ncbi:open rectifier potassium channel protein 1 isoform X1 [Hylaeus volcanicus]|uniref:open rectifier potassium channel protein 1 isoform X1 n=2 Tax=Hylaeus volcanicus TaxID=313075 RepID=UPI0023B7E686|nr:open rectifier potassium channel protein 1 isoform X1 [Hylaeus volcanicus]XP_053974603.1 open rectifier potassium channel protein 1 isoform X1 [Hylaeus volcanicus]XP_053974604.1 open rectifier potassium channel protein 1 isoform X1 [Hylaeus volcanicus]XP_053974605.1 open rectifier potassium channel protein 1 isoform X1 [Hylaeus volcanicus]XP_053974606.1 open rectifier potassium channel protein 1 isoform X1 [Hylaeus volcanicus]
MSKKQWMVLLMLFLTYLLLGASIFYHIESRLEIERVEKAKQERIEINALLHTHYMPSSIHDHDEILDKLTKYCGKSVYNYSEGETDPLKWDFYNSFYFAYTVASTIGYGNLAPTNMLGRILMIFYGLVGIPINGILLAQLGEFFGSVFVKAHQKYKAYKHGRNDYHPRKLTTFETGKLGLAAQIFVYLMPGFIMFIFFPAFLFSHYEGWSYDEAVYYAFVTLTTIGFGDYVAGQDNSKGSGVFFILYKTFLICWISFGLGYIVMIMTFIARGMRSKKITRIERKLALNLKHTQSKIWNEFNKEIDYVRRVFNELQLSKVKRVYVDECIYEIPPAKFPRSNSFPDLRELLHGARGNDSMRHYRPRRRANSEVVPTEEEKITRVVSETDLQRIDKTATFATHAMVQPAELLARLVNILGYIPPATDDIGVDGSNQTTFVEPEIMHRSRIDDNLKDSTGKEPIYPHTSNGTGSWAIGNERILRSPQPRSRAASEIRLHETKNEDRHVDWTWSGPMATRKIREMMRSRTNEPPSKDNRGGKDKFSRFRTFSLAKSVPKALISSGPWKSRFSSSMEKKSTEVEGNAKDPEESFVSGASSFDDRRQDSITASTSRRNYYTHTGAGNNNTSETEGSSLLEETSLADFLRALTLLHASVATTGSWTAGTTDDDLANLSRPRRKMGTASLSPPKLPSLFTLFSSPPPGTTTQSNQNTITQESSLPAAHNLRRSSLVFANPTTVKPRRFSLRPVPTPISPPTPPRSGSPFLSDSRRMPYVNNSTFAFDSYKEPLIRTEGAPGLSSPMVGPPPPSTPVNSRRFSLRPTQNQGGISTPGSTTTTPVPPLKGLPRWKAGMLQRQIGQKNLRRRVRAFSLSDVHVDDGKEKTADSSSNIYTKKNGRDIPRRNDGPRETGGESTSSDLRETVPTKIRFEDKGTPLSKDTIQRTTPDGSEGKEQSRATVPRNEYTSFVTADIESRQPLVEVKVENPAVSSVQGTDFLNLMELKVEKPNSSSSES